MSILQRIRSDLDRGLLEHRAKVLLQVIRERLGELTLGDLREILASKLGQGLAALRLSELTGGAGEAPALPGAEKSGKRAAKAKAKTKAKASKSKSKAKATAAKRSTGTFGAELLEKVGQTLREAGVPMTSGELRAALGGSKATMYRAVRELVRAGKIATAGKPARYSVKGEGTGAAKPEAPAKSEAPATKAAKKSGAKTAGKKRAAKRAGGKKAGKKGAAKQAKAEPAGSTAKGSAARAEAVTGRTAEGRAQFDGKVLAALREAGEWLGATPLREKVGGSDNQLRIALHRLIGEGKVVRRGARNSTEYRLGG